MDLPEIPPIPQEILDAIDKEEFSIFIGAGVSRLVGCIGWDELARNLINICNKHDGRGNSIINFQQKRALEKIPDHRKVITICHKILYNNGKSKQFESEMKKALLVNRKIKKPNIYDFIAKIKATKITTNADRLFDDYFNENNIKYLESDFNIDNEPINEEYLYHIHGSIDYPKTIVYTLEQYFRRYRGSYIDFLRELFSKKTILFIGYGLSEFELLEYLFLRTLSNIPPRKHFLLQGYLTGEENTVEFDKIYYEDMNIELFPFSMDTNGFNQLSLIMEFWAKEVNNKTIKLKESLRVIKDAIN